MTEKTLVVLMGEQPVPLLLSIREQEPDRVIIIHTDKTKERADNLQEVIAGKVDDIVPVKSKAYDLLKVIKDIQASLPEEGEVIFDATGGTKVMSLAAVLIAQQQRSKITYIITENSQGQILTLGNPIEKHPLSSATFTLEEYFKLYYGSRKYRWWQQPPASSAKSDKGARFERAVCNALKARFGKTDEEEIWCDVHVQPLKGSETALQVDIVLRCGIQVGVAEIKANKTKKKNSKKARHAALTAVHQATTYGNQKLFGTYVKRFAIVQSGSPPIASDPNIKVEVIKVGSGNSISGKDADLMVETIRQAMACK